MVHLKYRDDRPVIYVSGPLSAPTGWEWEQNVRRAEEIGYFLKYMEFAPVVPHTDDRFFHAHHERKLALEVDIALLSRCDGLLLIPGWEASEGAKDEAHYCDHHGIPVLCCAALPWTDSERQRIKNWGERLPRRLIPIPV